MNTSDNLIIDKDEETKKRFHSFRAKTSDQDEDEEHSKRKWQKLRNIILGISPNYKNTDT